MLLIMIIITIMTYSRLIIMIIGIIMITIIARIILIVMKIKIAKIILTKRLSLIVMIIEVIIAVIITITLIVMKIGITLKIRIILIIIQGQASNERNIIWLNPAFSKKVATKIGRYFLNLIDKDFPRDSKFHKIFNRSSIKVSYTSMLNAKLAIILHNRKNLHAPVDN